MKKRLWKQRISVVLMISMTMNLWGMPAMEYAGLFDLPYAAMAKQMTGGGVETESSIDGLDNNTPDTMASPSDIRVTVKELRLPDGTEEWLTVDLGTGKDEIGFPGVLEALIETEDGTEADEITNLEWNCADFDPEQVGLYEFEPRLSANYQVKSGVDLPKIRVCVGNNLITSIQLPDDALDTYFASVGTEVDELGLPEWLDATICGTDMVQVPVRWICRQTYQMEQAGEYVFTALLDDTYLLISDIIMPEVQVTVSEVALLADAVKEPLLDGVKINEKTYLGDPIETPWRKAYNVSFKLSAQDDTIGQNETLGNVYLSLDNKEIGPLEVKNKNVITFTLNDTYLKNLEIEKEYDFKASYFPSNGNTTKLENKLIGKIKVVKNTLSVVSNKVEAKGTYEDSLWDIQQKNWENSGEGIRGDVIITGSKPTVQVKGKWQWDLNEETAKTTFPTVGEKNGYTATFSNADPDCPSENFTNPTISISNIKPVISPKQIYVFGTPILKVKEYNGADGGEVDTIKFTRDLGRLDEVDLKAVEDYKTTVKYNDPFTPGDGRSATVTVTIENDNYKLDTKSYPIQGLEIKKSSLPLKVKNSVDSNSPTVFTYEIYAGESDLIEIIDLCSSNGIFRLNAPDGATGSVGDITTETTMQPQDTTDAVKFLGLSVDGKNTLQVAYNSGTEAGSRGVIPIKIKSTYFNDVDVEVHFKIIPPLEPMENPSDLVKVTGDIYAFQTIANATQNKSPYQPLKLNGSFRDTTAPSVTVEGILEWQDMSQEYEAGRAKLYWVFTPKKKTGDYRNKYTSISGECIVDVSKAPGTTAKDWKGSVQTEFTSYPYGTSLKDIRLVDGNGEPVTVWAFTNPDLKPAPTKPGPPSKQTIRFTSSDSKNFEIVEKKDFPVSIHKSSLVVETLPEAKGTYGVANTINKYPITGGEVTSDGIRVEGKWAWDINIDKTSVPEVGTTKTYKAVFTPKDSKYYENITVDIVPQVSPLTIQSISKVTLKQKYYDGTANGEVELIQCKPSVGSTVTLKPDEYQATVTYDNFNAGKGRIATVWVTSKSKNYVFLPADGKLFYEVKSQTIEKSTERPDVMPTSMTCYATMDPKKTLKTTFDLDQFAVIPKKGQTTGVITYTLSPITTTVGSYSVPKGSGILTITAKKWTGRPLEDKVRVYVDTENYQQTSVELYVKGTNKLVPILAEQPMTYTSKLGAGQPLSRLKLNQSKVFVDVEGNTVEGSVTWLNPDQTFSAGTHSVTWVFTPTDQEKYIPVTGSVVITVVNSNFTVTVNGGTESGNYAEGAIVELRAHVPDQHKFLGWTGPASVKFADASQPNTTFIMPAENVTVTARIEQKPSYEVVVKNGEGSGTYFVGDTVTVKAVTPSAKYKFSHWTAEQEISFADAKSETTTFTLPGPTMGG